ncbi:single-stranded DNA-binding protein [Brochothrix phage BtpYZU03]|nr:single-stranded DNA-binding protein [Brochothrix phage BtpYZU03]
MNKTMLTGRLVKDVELKYTQGGSAIATATVAVKRGYKNKEGEYESDFPRIKAFGKTAEFFAKYFKKGDVVEICGSIQTGKYEDNDGKTIYTTDIVADGYGGVGFALKQSQDNAQQTKQQNGNQYSQNKQSGSQGQTSNFSNPFASDGKPYSIDDKDLPF